MGNALPLRCLSHLVKTRDDRGGDVPARKITSVNVFVGHEQKEIESEVSVDLVSELFHRGVCSSHDAGGSECRVLATYVV